MLVDLDGTRVLTDPILRHRIMHLRTVHRSPSRAELGRVDAVLLSHAHRDHADVRSLARVGRRIPVVAPHAVVRSLRRRGFRGRAEPIEAGEDRAVGSLEVHATPAVHGRPGTAVGFLVRGTRSVYFAGDTDLFPEMEGLADPLDVALMPIWGWGPTLGEGHLDPERAVEAVRLLRPRVVIPIHWGSLHPLGMSDRAFLRDPAPAFLRLAAERTPEVEVRVLRPGATTDFTT